jgi:hypothetical protein
VPAKFGPRFAWPHKCLRNELNKTEYEPTNDRSIYYGSGYLIPAFHGIERTFSWLLSSRLDALLLHVPSLDAALPLFILQHARKKIFVSNNTDKKNIVSDKCHKLSFYFRLASFGQRPAFIGQPLV